MRNTRKSIKAIVSFACANAAALIAPCSSSIVCVCLRGHCKKTCHAHMLSRKATALIYATAPNNKAALGSSFGKSLTSRLAYALVSTKVPFWIVQSKKRWVESCSSADKIAPHLSAANISTKFKV